MSNVLYVTSFNKHLYDATGRNLLESFIRTDTEGKLLATCEELDLDNLLQSGTNNIIYYDLIADDFLNTWLKENKDIIPTYLGGIHKGEFKHKFHKRTSQWFRKIAALHVAVQHKDDFRYVVFVDSDSLFKQKVTEDFVKQQFAGASVIYHYGNCRRTHPSGDGIDGIGIESGLIGFDLHNGGDLFLKEVFKKYTSKSFRTYARWDDAWMFTICVRENQNKKIKCKDLVSESKSTHVVGAGPFKDYITHDKGVHWKKHGIQF
jgi:hypothetical protein